MAVRWCGEVKIVMRYMDSKQEYLCHLRTPEGTHVIHVGEPAYLQHAVDSALAYDSAAHAALSFAVDEAPDGMVAAFAELDDEGQGWFITRKKGEL